MTAKQPYEGYTLPRSSEKGQPFVDFNEVLKEVENKNGNIRRIRKRK